VQLEPRNKIAQGRELICEGQIDRMRSRYTHNGRVSYNPKLLSQATGCFQRAAELMPDSPDPYLAMATVYLYYEQDYERGMAMQQAALKRGHSMGKRETAQLADTKRAYARHDLALGQEQDDSTDHRKQHLENAISAFDTAIEYYGQIAGFASSTAGLHDAMQGRQQAQKLLDQMQTR
jgi:tetratricopeptide (TPR) repeat protein